MTVDNFLYNYVQRKCYDNTIMHYSTNDIVMAGGYQADLTEIAPRAPVRNESDNGLTNEIGTVAMSRSPEYPHSATSQFFVNLGKNSVFDYEADAEEDKKFRERVDARNQADGLIHAAEKTLHEAGDKVSGEERHSVESAVSDLKAVIDDGDKETIETKTAALAKASAAVAQKLYAEEAAAGGDATEGSDKETDDVVDAEFEEVDSDDDESKSG
jgi:cyclophilin family peptidyl-prolyl cis-trans isomerase